MQFDDEINELFISINNMIVIQSSERLRECYFTTNTNIDMGLK